MASEKSIQTAFGLTRDHCDMNDEIAEAIDTATRAEGDVVAAGETVDAQSDDLPSVGGRRLTEWTVAEFERNCQVLIRDEQEKPNCDTRLIAVLCNAVRLAREQTDLMKQPITSAPPVATADARKHRDWHDKHAVWPEEVNECQECDDERVADIENSALIRGYEQARGDAVNVMVDHFELAGCVCISKPQVLETLRALTPAPSPGEQRQEVE